MGVVQVLGRKKWVRLKGEKNVFVSPSLLPLAELKFESIMKAAIVLRQMQLALKNKHKLVHTFENQPGLNIYNICILWAQFVAFGDRWLVAKERE